MSVRNDPGPEVSPAMLAAAYPAFQISLEPRGSHQLRWAAVRKKATDQGLYAVVTPDLDELHAVLAAAAAGRPGNGRS
jgi:hypothetical protein